MAATESAMLAANTPSAARHARQQENSRRSIGRNGSCTTRRTAASSASVLRHGQLAEHLTAHVGHRRAVRAAQAELARALRDALPDDTGEPERDHQQQEAGDDRDGDERCRELLQHVVPLLGRPAARRTSSRRTRPAAASPAAPRTPRLFPEQPGSRARSASCWTIGGLAGAVETEAVKEEVVRVRELAVLPEIVDDADDALVLPRVDRDVSSGTCFTRMIRPAASSVPKNARASRRLMTTGFKVSASSSRENQRPCTSCSETTFLKSSVTPLSSYDASRPSVSSSPLRQFELPYGPGVRGGGRLHLRQFPGSRDELLEGGDHARRSSRRSGADHVDVPDAIDVEAERLAPVVGVREAGERDPEQDEEREEDLDRQQDVVPLAVPDQRDRGAGSSQTASFQRLDRMHPRHPPRGIDAGERARRPAPAARRRRTRGRSPRSGRIESSRSR